MSLLIILVIVVSVLYSCVCESQDNREDVQSEERSKSSQKVTSFKYLM